MQPIANIASLLPHNELKKPLSYYLRHKLNPNCLIEIFQSLEFCDLLSICDLDSGTDQFFTELIREHVICGKYINFEVPDYQQSVWSFDRIFEVFGNSMRIINLPLHKYCLNRILKAIINHCKPGTLTEFRLIVKGSYLPKIISNHWI